MLLEKVQTSLKNSCFVDSQDTLLVGVSGGADSMTLLDILVQSGYKPIVAHFDHQLRPQSGQDAEFVRRRVQEYGLEFVLGNADVGAQARESGQGIEEAAREARYRFMFSLAEQRSAAALAVAHQADDQVETVLMNLLRGSGLKGLGGMRYRSFSPFHASIPLVRPLLGCWRDEILTYCREHGLTYVTDASNQDCAYRRNRIRLELLPELESYNPQIKQALFRMADLLAKDIDLIDAAVNHAVEQTGLQIRAGYAELNVEEFRRLSVAAQRGLIRKILSDAFPQEDELGAHHIEQARRCLNRETESLNTQLNDIILVRVENERGLFLNAADAGLPDSKWPCLAGELRLPAATGTTALAEGWKIRLELISKEALGDDFIKNNDNFCAYLALDKLNTELLLRTWREGDRYQPLGMAAGQQKVSDFWINNKVPLRAKGHWPLLFSDDLLIWIPGFPPAEAVRVTAQTRQILKVHFYRQTD
jgi:tRNA(Ile)-lysidine synthase